MAYKDIEKRNAWFRARYETNQTFLQNFKLEKGCTDCGYKAHHAGLEFDHIGDDKVHNVSALAGRSMNAILKELAKCEVVCGTCHNIRTWNRRKGL